jgi:hypothetical protein
MKKIGIARMAYELEFKLSANFTFQTSHVYTVSNKVYNNLFPKPEPFPDEIFGVKIPKEKEVEESQFGHLIIDSTFDLEPYDSLLEGSAKIRPQLLVIHGIMTFLTNKVFIIFQNPQSIHSVVEWHIVSNTKPKKFVAEKINYIADLEKILLTIANSNDEKKILIFTLFERWRKALHFDVESEESFLYIDEAVLAYIHILEVLADEYKVELNKSIKIKRNELINQVIECVDNSSERNLKKINSLLNQINSNQVTLKSKITQMLIEFGLDNPKSDAIVSRYIEHRNAIAHGRKNLYQDKVVYPLKPFFSFIKDIDENTVAIKVLSAKTISSYLDLAAWNTEWELVLFYEPTHLALVKDFIVKEKYKTISGSDFLNGIIDGITPETLAYYCIKKRFKTEELELALLATIISAKATKKNFQILFNAAVLLSDSQNTVLANKCREIIQTVHEKKWGFYSNIRDIIKAFEYHNITLQWFGQWLTNRAKR